MPDLTSKRAFATVIVAGPAGAHLFGRPDASAAQDALRKRWGGSAAWVLAQQPEDLARMLRDASLDGAPCAVMWPLVPAGGDEMVMRRAWREWCDAVARCAVQGVAPVPAYVAMYACLGPAGEHPVTQRSHVSRGDSIDGGVNLRHAVQALRNDAAHVMPGPGMLRQRLALSVVDWAAEGALLAVMEDLASVPPLYPAGVFLVDAGETVPNMSAWLRWLTARTGLTPNLPRPKGSVLPLPPLAFEPGLPQAGWVEQAAAPAVKRRWGKEKWAACIVTLTLATAVLLGIPYQRATQNMDRIAADLRHYQTLPPERMFEKCAALIQLGADHDELASHLGEGGPRSWLHHQTGGERLWMKLEDAISAYQPPQTALRLDGMAAFESGSAYLVRPTALRLLDPVAQLLRANPDLRVQVVGHADATGSAEKNLALSLARAQAVREALMEMSGALPARFQVAGRGSAQPSDDNATVQGRALNRRVEITLTAPPSAGFACGAFNVRQTSLLN